ncbi:phosphate propanoyltransferase [Alkaliphilus crotonatoxidans]
MDIDIKKIEKWVYEIIEKMNLSTHQVPVGVSNRHIHLSQGDCKVLFGANHTLTPLKALKQPGQYAAEETVDLLGPKGTIHRVRVLGPLRKQTQVEISKTDGFLLGVNAPIRESGDLKESPGVIIKGPKGQVEIKEGLIVALRHIHMPEDYARLNQYTDGEMVSVDFQNTERPTTFHGVKIRVSPVFSLEMHVDTDEANGAGLKNGSIGTIVRQDQNQSK